MTSVVPFPGRTPVCARAYAADLQDAVWMATILVKEWGESTENVVLGREPFLGEAFPDPPRIILEGIEVSVMDVMGRAATMWPLKRVPAPLSLFLGFWNWENSVETYADLEDFIEAMTDVACDLQDRFLARRGGAA